MSKGKITDSELSIDLQNKIKLIEEHSSQLEEIIKQSEINVDMFEGSDVEKLQQALDYCIDSNCRLVRLNREYNITGGTIKYNCVNMWHYITFVGGSIIKNDEGYMFDSDFTGNGRNAVRFINTIFKTNVDNVYVFNGDKTIRQYVDNCTFVKVGLVNTVDYLQSVRVHNCEIGQLGCNFIEGDNIFDGEISHTRFESSTNDKYSAIVIQTKKTGISYFGFRILNSLIEGYTRTTPIILGVGYGLKIDGNYFEANKTSIKFDNKGMSSTLISGIISTNCFGASKSDYDIEFVGNVNNGRLHLDGNTSNQPTGKFLSSVPIIKNFIDTNNIYAGGKVERNIGTSTEVRDTSLNVIQKDLGVGGISFEIPLNLKNSGQIYNQDIKQFLVNIKSTFGSSVHYSAHWTGILSIDGHYKDGSVKYEIMSNVISTRNTSGNNNGNLSNPTELSFVFKETGSELIEANVATATLLITLPKMKFDNKNKVSVTGINALVQQYKKDNI